MIPTVHGYNCDLILRNEITSWKTKKVCDLILVRKNKYMDDELSEYAHSLLIHCVGQLNEYIS